MKFCGEMTHIWQALRSGEWLTAARARGYGLILLGICTVAAVGWVILSDGLTDLNGKPIGTDFSSFYAAGSMALEGHAADIYDMAAHYARQQQIFGASTPYYAWFYPPFLLFIAAPLALLPYPAALILWQAVTLAFYLGVIGAILRPIRQSRPDLGYLWVWLALGFPAVFINLGHGQNGLLTAALLGTALLTLARRPLLSGTLFGLLAYKPQFALIIPIAMLASNRWRAIAAAAATLVVLFVLSVAAFGTEIWYAFAASTDISRKLLLQNGDVGFAKLQSTFAAVRMWGGGIPLAYIAQGAVSIAAVCGVAWTWRGSFDFNTKAVLLTIATLLASPHTLDYDLMILGPAIAFMACAGFAGGVRGFEISLLAAAWIVPLLSRIIAGVTGIPLGLLVLLVLYVFTLRRVVRDGGSVIEIRGIAQA
jgi:alpha-1,2-mannosyltransferase